MSNHPATLLCFLTYLLLPVPGFAESLSEQAVRELVAASDRSEADRERDERRKPVEFLQLTGVSRGDRVADLGAGSGYTTELLARAVGPEGKVYGHNTPRTIERYVSESWPARLAKPVNQVVVRVDRELSDPLPDEANNLDLITIVFFYHDATLYGVEGRELAKQFFEALRPGGAVVLVDHSAVPGSPIHETADKLHRIDEEAVKADFTAAGFKLSASADFMRNPDDPKDTPFFKQEQPTDAFVHRWVKPE